MTILTKPPVLTEDKWPEYKSHKVVQAIKVLDEVPLSNGWRIETQDGGHIVVDVDWYNKHVPEHDATFAGGYLVKYADGYLSWSPAAAFEAGYSRL